MEPTVVAVVLAAALLHAAWNALVKVGGDALARMALLTSVSGLMALPLLAWVGLPSRASLPLLFCSVALHQLYFALLLQSYRTGDFSVVYPIARGGAPLFVTVGAALVAGERPGWLGVVGVLVVSGGIVSLAASDLRRQAARRAALFAGGTAVTIALYSLSDGLGARASGNVLGYMALLFALSALPLVSFALVRRRRELAAVWRANARAGVLGGALSFGAYGLCIWAMSRAPLGYVAALREVSVVVAALLGVRLMGEPFGGRRVAAAAAVAAGIALLHFGR